MHQETVTYPCEGTSCKGYLVYDTSSTAKRPAILIVPAFRGLDDFVRKKTHELAEAGYAAFAADLYGNGLEVKTNEEAQALMMPLFINRQLLRHRITSAFDALAKMPFVDTNKIGAIGFCFGGLTVIELLRSGAGVRGVVSFHGALGDTLWGIKADVVPPAKDIKGSLLILHGNQDPIVSLDDILSIQSEFTKAGVDWQMNIYGHTVHAFTNPQVSDFKGGYAFNELANRRSWQAMHCFFDEIFHKT